MTYTIGIVAHHVREPEAKALNNQVQAQVLSIDPGVWGCTTNHIRVWAQLAQHNTDWLVVLEDDAIVCDDFHTQLAEVLERTPCEIVSLYLGTSRPPQWQSHATSAVKHANRMDASFIAAPALLHAVAVCIQTPLVPDMLTHIATLDDPIDEAITDWAQTTGRMVAYTHPSIVDHHDTPTLVEHRDQHPRTQPRKAHQHGTRQHWTNQYVIMS